jgi:hypothetical protein
MRYLGEQFLFIVDSSDVTIYNLYSNNSIAGFASGFSLPPQNVPITDGRYEFWVHKRVFGQELGGMEVVDCGAKHGGP